MVPQHTAQFAPEDMGRVVVGALVFPSGECLKVHDDSSYIIRSAAGAATVGFHVGYCAVQLEGPVPRWAQKDFGDSGAQVIVVEDMLDGASFDIWRPDPSGGGHWELADYHPVLIA